MNGRCKWPLKMGMPLDPLILLLPFYLQGIFGIKENVLYRKEKLFIMYKIGQQLQCSPVRDRVDTDMGSFLSGMIRNVGQYTGQTVK